ncbi:MAG UNVERIFIED_CONTAM: hypothetical protein LVR29_06195 [Microcystis novacekii LVE1205-3]
MIVVELKPNDFQVTLQGTSQLNRVLAKQVKMEPFEKVELEITVEALDSATLSRRIGGRSDGRTQGILSRFPHFYLAEVWQQSLL